MDVSLGAKLGTPLRRCTEIQQPENVWTKMSRILHTQTQQGLSRKVLPEGMPTGSKISADSLVPSQLAESLSLQ